MDELSLYILDITMNSVRAGATEISVTLEEDGSVLCFTVTDNGCGMTEEQVAKLTDPFFTTRKTRKVGLGIPFLRMLAELTGGSVTVESVSEKVSEQHGTTTRAVFHEDHIDFIPLGDIIGTMVTLIQGSPEINFTFRHTMPGGEVTLSCAELSEALDGVSLAEPEVLAWIRDYLAEQYAAVNPRNQTQKGINCYEIP